VFEAFSTAVIYDFKSNAQAVLGDSAKAAASLADSLDTLTTSFGAADKSAAAASKAFYSAANGIETFRYAQRQFNVGVDALARGFDRVAGAAGKMDGVVSTAMGNIDTEVGITAARVDAASVVMETGLNSVATAARSAAAGISSVSVAGNRMQRYSGNVGAGAAAGAGAAGAGAAGHGGMGMTKGDVAGLIGLGVLGSAVKTTGDLNQSSAQLGVALGMNTADTEKIFRPIAMQMSQITAQSTVDTMNELQLMATSGFNSPRDLQGNNAALPMQVARYADTQLLGMHHVPVEQSVTTAVTLAHQLGTRTDAELKPMLDTLFKISQDMPDVVGRAATQIKFYGAQYVNAGVAPSEILQLQATADRLGYGGGRSGSGFRSIIQALQTPDNTQFTAQSNLGLISGSRMVRGADGKMHRQTENRYIDSRTGQFDVEGFFKHLNQLYDQARKNGTVGAFNSNLGHLATSGAVGLLSSLSSDAGIRQRLAVAATLGRVQGLEAAQAQYIDTLNGQTQLLTSNFKALTGVIGMPLQGPLKNLVHGLAAATGGASNFLQQHPVANDIAAGALTLLAMKGVASVFKLVGGVSILVEKAAAHAGTSELRVGAHIRVPHGVGRGAGMPGGGGARFSPGRTLTGASGAFDGIADFLVGGVKSALTASGLRGMPEAFAKFGSSIGLVSEYVQAFGVRAAIAGGGVRLVAGAVGMLALKAASGVGDIWLLWDALNYLKSHMPSVTSAIGNAAVWIRDVGGPMIGNALKGAVTYAADAIGKFFSDGKFAEQVMSHSLIGDQGPIQAIIDEPDKIWDYMQHHGKAADPHGQKTYGGKGNIPRTTMFGQRADAHNAHTTPEEIARQRHRAIVLRDHPGAWVFPDWAKAFQDPSAGGDSVPTTPARPTLRTVPALPTTAQPAGPGNRWGAPGGTSPRQTDTRQHADSGTRVIRIAAVNVYPAPGDRVEEWIDKVEKHFDLDHVGQDTPTRSGAHAGTTNGTSHSTLG
jgi:hypothetical protein